MQPHELAEAFAEVQASHSIGGKARASAWRVFKQFCDTATPPLEHVVSYSALKAHLVARVYVDLCKSSGLKATASNLKNIATTLHRWLMTPQQYSVITTVDIPALCKQMPAQRDGGCQLTPSQLEALLDAICNAGNTPTTRLLLAAVTMLVSFQARPAELLQPIDRSSPFRGAIFGNTEFGLFGLLMHSQYSKTHQFSLDPYPKVALCWPQGPGDNETLRAKLCASTALFNHLKLDMPGYGAYWHDPKGHYALRPLLSVLKADALGVLRGSTEPLSTDGLRRLLAPFLREAGIQEQGFFGMHFGRATGTAMLYRFCSLGRPETRELGGWAPDDTQGKHYAHPEPISMAFWARETIAQRKALANLAISGVAGRVTFCCSEQQARARGARN
jgi:hypothetical protein